MANTSGDSLTGLPDCTAVLGAGSWGSALAMQLGRSGRKCVLWGRSREQIEAMRLSGSNEKFLPGIPFPPHVSLAHCLDEVLSATDEVLVAVPSHAFTAILKLLAPMLAPGQGLSWACKGLEPGSGRFLHQAAQDVVGRERPLAVITGPSFAIEVARGLPTAVTVAGTEPAYCKRMAQVLHGGNFRAYTSDDIVGAELGGAVKNVLAIATGISDGMALGNNARAALITRGLAEMMRLGRAMGAREQTLIGLAGMGDLVLTSTSDLSRNRRLGLALGSGHTVERAVADIGQLVEGISTSAEVWRMAQRHAVEMPISEQIHGVIHFGWNPKQCLRDLLAREQKPELI
ncbi:MAG TPA: NAD(P)H-dependent glycerol-3-phosphate dehydrogenase [Xanthomonadales bacterium]|nr:NAD(P)H-dependent glycerol-3-phosphate dehydrogenase [Xanthomonadales bacterium]